MMTKRTFPMESVARLLKAALIEVFQDTGRFPIRILEATEGEADGRALVVGEGEGGPQLVECDVEVDAFGPVGTKAIRAGWKLLAWTTTPATRHQPEDADVLEVGPPFTAPTAAVTAMITFLVTGMAAAAMEAEGWTMHVEDCEEVDRTLDRLLAERNCGKEAHLWNT